MLVLGRYVDEKIILRDRKTGEQIEIMVTDIDINRRKPRVKLGISAPQQKKILREEIDDSKNVSDYRNAKMRK